MLPDEKIIVIWWNIKNEVKKVEKFVDFECFNRWFERTKGEDGFYIDLIGVGREVKYSSEMKDTCEPLHECSLDHEKIYYQGVQCPMCRLRTYFVYEC